MTNIDKVTSSANIEFTDQEIANIVKTETVSQIAKSMTTTDEDTLVETSFAGDSYKNNSTSNTSTTELPSTKAELNSLKTTKEAELADLQETLQSIYDLTEPTIASKKSAMDSAQSEFETLVSTEGQSNSEVQALSLQLNSIEDKIKQNEEDRIAKEEEIEEKEKEIEEKESENQKLIAEYEALEESYNEWNSIAITDENSYDVELQLESLQDRMDSVSSKISTGVAELHQLQSDCASYEDDLSSIKSEGKSLESERSSTEQELSSKITQVTNNALAEYQNARSDFETTKTSMIENTQAAITSKQSEISTITSKISQIEAEEVKAATKAATSASTTSDYNISSTSYGSEYNAERGQALADAANSLYGGTTKAGGYCAKGVSQAIQKAFGGERIHGNGCDYGDILANTAGWTEITSSITSAADLKNLPAGAVVSWSTYEAGHTKSNGKYGHVFISDGQGHEISDFKSNISTSYANWGATYRVFIPT